MRKLATVLQAGGLALVVVAFMIFVALVVVTHWPDPPRAGAVPDHVVWTKLGDGYSWTVDYPDGTHCLDLQWQGSTQMQCWTPAQWAAQR